MNRRKFFRRIGLGIFASSAILAYKGLSRQKLLHDNNTIIISENILKDQQFIEGIFVRLINGKPKFLSAKCTHLGCQINQLKNDELLCPCHGSSYDMSGKVLNGPAQRNLNWLDFEYDAEKKEYLVYKSS